MATEMAKAYIQIMPSAKGIKGMLTDLLGPEAERGGQSAGATLASRLKGAIAAAGIGSALSSALTEGAALEQSLGGVETLFKDSADAVIRNAENAYRSAGLSANEYMETVTGFTASLLKSLGGDTAAAAAMGDMAVTDMADNANKMGTSLESIQNAYQGFARGSYVMLDNLKLGYGGSQQEMQRLLKDAQDLSGVKYDMSNLADVYSAIHVIQEDLGITGATAAEAASTISGSFAALKASAQNVLASLTLGRDIGPALEALAQTVIAFVTGNLLPALWNIISALPGALVTLVQALIPENLAAVLGLMLTNLQIQVEANLPGFLQEGVRMLTGLVTGLMQALPGFLSTVGGMLSQALSLIFAAWPQLQEAGFELITGLASGIWNNLPAVITSIANILAQLLIKIAAHLPQLLQSGISLIARLAAGLIQAIPQVAAAIPQIIGKIVEIFKVHDWMSLGRDIIRGIANGIKNGVSLIVDAAKEAAKAALEAAKDFLGIASPSRVMADSVGRWIPAGVAQGIRNNISPVTQAMDALTRQTSGTLERELAFTLSGSTAGKAVPADNSPALLEALQMLLAALVSGNRELVEAILAEQRLKLNEREFARLVKAVMA